MIKEMPGIIEKNHIPSQGLHVGLNRTVESIKENNYYWNNIYRFVELYISKFKICSLLGAICYVVLRGGVS